jgi:hypothetical protein
MPDPCEVAGESRQPKLRRNKPGPARRAIPRDRARRAIACGGPGSGASAGRGRPGATSAETRAKRAVSFNEWCLSITARRAAPSHRPLCRNRHKGKS